MIFSTIVIFFILTVLALYTRLLWVAHSQHRSAVNQFIKAWNDQTYSLHSTYDYDTSKKIIRVKFPSLNNERHFNIDSDGVILSSIVWANVNISTDMKPSNYMRKKINDITVQLATVHKLTDTPDLNQAGLGVMTSP